MEPQKITLSTPIRVGGEMVKELTVEEPKAKHYEMIDQLAIKIDQNGEIELKNLGSLGFFAAMNLANGGLTAKEAGELAMKDLFSLAYAVAGFFGFGVKTGGIPFG